MQRFNLPRTVSVAQRVGCATRHPHRALMTTPARAHLAREIALLFLLATLWAASYTFIKIAVRTIPPLSLMAGRTVIAAALLVAVLRWQGVALPSDPATWKRFVLQACLNSVVPFTLIAWAQQDLDASLATILNSATPMFAFGLTALFFRHEAVTTRRLVGVVLGIVGIVLVMGLQSLQGVGDGLLLQQFAVLAASACFAMAAIFGTGFKGLHPGVPAAGSLIAGAVLLVPASLVIDRPWALSPSGASIAAMLALAAFSTALAFLIYFRLMQTLGTVGTTAQAYLRVPIGVGFGVFFLGESLSSTALIGMLFVVVGVAAMTVPGRR